jgi:hypothetical protein
VRTSKLLVLCKKNTKKKIQCIYIDLPYNTNASPILHSKNLESIHKLFTSEKLGFSFILPVNQRDEKVVWQRTFERAKKRKRNLYCQK